MTKNVTATATGAVRRRLDAFLFVCGAIMQIPFYYIKPARAITDGLTALSLYGTMRDGGGEQVQPFREA